MKQKRRPWGLLSDSTRVWMREARRMPGISWFDLVHGYVYTRWPYLYIGLAVGEHPLSRLLSPLLDFLARWLTRRAQNGREPVTFADTYHGKVMPVESAKRLIAVQQPISLADLGNVIPYTRARAILLENPDHIVVLECPCRAARENPCRPLDVCLIVGEPFASFVIEHHPRRSRWITQQEAVDILQAEHERGHVQHAFFKDAMLGRYYAICNCCSCCCGAMQAQRGGVPMLAGSGYVNQVDAARCVGCGRCVQACPFAALSLSEGVIRVDLTRCMGCGVCVGQCEHGAAALVRHADASVPLEIETLLAQAR